MKRQAAADAVMTAAILFLGASLVFTGGAVLRHRSSGPHPSAPLDLAEAVGAAAAGIGFAVALWWLAALACAFISGLARLHGRPGLASLTDAWTPAFMRRLAAVVLGLNLMAAPAAMAAGLGPIDPKWHAGPAAEAPFIVKTAHPAAPGLAESTAGAADPAKSKARPGTQRANPAWTPQAPAVDPGPLARRQTRPPRNAVANGADNGEVVVRGGDSLWSIVAAALGPYATDVEVAQAWPEWYRANRSVIGSDPNIILPGQVLHAPGR